MLSAFVLKMARHRGFQEGCAQVTGPIAAAAAELQARLVSFVRDNRLPGGAAGVVHGGELAWSSAVGYADTSTRRLTGPGTLYRIASITKPFTGTVVMQLRDAGQLDLDDPAVTYLPELRGAVSPFAPIERVTIRRMLSHESGLASEPPGTDWAVRRTRATRGALWPGPATLSSASRRARSTSTPTWRTSCSARS